MKLFTWIEVCKNYVQVYKMVIYSCFEVKVLLYMGRIYISHILLNAFKSNLYMICYVKKKLISCLLMNCFCNISVQLQGSFSEQILSLKSLYSFKATLQSKCCLYDCLVILVQVCRCHFCQSNFKETLGKCREIPVWLSKLLYVFDF